VHGWTALIHASSKCHTAIVELLLAAGADKDAKSERMKGGMVATPMGTLPLLAHEAKALHVLYLG
jgi:ankyrin repeat protein